MRSSVVALVLVASASACRRAEPPVLVPDPAPPAAAAPAPAPGATLPAPAQAALERALGAYEAIRVALVADQVAGVEARAAELVAAVDAARQALPGDVDAAVTAALEAFGREARGLGAGDLEATRAQFGRTSKALVALGGRVPAVRAGRHVFSCPMTEHYRKWVQVTPRLENPLYGSKMLTCGEADDWTE